MEGRAVPAVGWTRAEDGEGDLCELARGSRWRGAVPAVGWTRADGVRKVCAVCAVWPVEDDEGDDEGDDEEEVVEGEREGEGDGEVDPSGQCPSG